MALNRKDVCTRAAAGLERANLAGMACTVGFDGFVDSIIEVVDKRHNAESYDRVTTIAAMARKIAAAAGESGNYELVTTLQKLGGNGPIMANALVAAGLPVTYVGSLGKPEVHGVFKEFAGRAKVVSLSEPGYTDALEFSDGKLMFGKHVALKEITYENMVGKLGKEPLTRMLGESKLIGVTNWTMLPNLTQMWKKLLSEIMPGMGKKEGRILFIDLADPEKRTEADLREALATLAKFEAYARTILGLNLKESSQVAGALGVPVAGDAEGEIEKTAAGIRAKLGIGCVVIHPRRGAAAADAEGSAAFAGPFVREPKISTGAGDHFNAGFCLGQMAGMGLAESLCVGTATSGFYVRNAISPTQGELVDFMRDLPAAEGDDESRRSEDVKGHEDVSIHR